MLAGDQVNGFASGKLFCILGEIAEGDQNASLGLLSGQNAVKFANNFVDTGNAREILTFESLMSMEDKLGGIRDKV